MRVFHNSPAGLAPRGRTEPVRPRLLAKELSVTKPQVAVRPIEQRDYAQWLPLWTGYNTFYEKVAPPEVTATTWARFFDASEPVHAVVAEVDGCLAGLVHFLFHRNTSTLAPVCYLQDLFTREDIRGAGVGRALIEAVYARAREAGSPRVYWMTHHTNTTAMALYDKVATHTGFVRYAKEL
jgi:GNAT superfamily N-acetyltransferase